MNRLSAVNVGLLMAAVVITTSAQGAYVAYTGEPHTVIQPTLTAENTYTYTADLAWWSNANEDPNVLGPWADDLWSYTEVRQNQDFYDALQLRGDPRGSMQYRFVLDLPADEQLSEVVISGSIKGGVIVRMRPAEGTSWYADLPVFGSTAAAYTSFSETVPTARIDTSTPGQIAFQVQLMNEGSSFSGGVYQFGVEIRTLSQAIPEPASMAMLGLGAGTMLFRRRR